MEKDFQPGGVVGRRRIAQGLQCGRRGCTTQARRLHHKLRRRDACTANYACTTNYTGETPAPQTTPASRTALARRLHRNLFLDVSLAGGKRRSALIFCSQHEIDAEFNRGKARMIRFHTHDAAINARIFARRGVARYLNLDAIQSDGF